MIDSHDATPRFIGYSRVSTDDQDLSLQVDALLRFGVSSEQIFSDKISGSKEERPGLNACLDSLKCGDTLVVWRLDRLGGRPKLRSSDPKIVLAQKLFADKSVEVDDICSTLKVSRSTLYRYVRMGRAEQGR